MSSVLTVIIAILMAAVLLYIFRILYCRVIDI